MVAEAAEGMPHWVCHGQAISKNHGGHALRRAVRDTKWQNLYADMNKNLELMLRSAWEVQRDFAFAEERRAIVTGTRQEHKDMGKKRNELQIAMGARRGE